MKYTEDALVEQPAIQLFAELEWETLTCLFGILNSSGRLQPISLIKSGDSIARSLGDKW